LQETGRCYWLTGLSGAGKTTLAEGFSTALRERGIGCVVLDGDEIRRGLNRDLGFGREGRRENVRRIAEIAKLLVARGLYVLVSAISPYEDDRRFARSLFGEGSFVEVHVAADRATCMARDPKGLYKRAQAGDLPNFTGIGDPYEAPVAPDIRVDTSVLDVTESILMLVDTLKFDHPEPVVAQG
jgi:adenylyl-sulfate kinase